MKKIIYTAAFLLFGLTLLAQNDVQYTHYLFNKLNYNPAYAGSAGVPVLTGIYRNQWLGLDKAPTTATANFHTPIMCGRGGLGIGITTDKAAIFTNNFLDISYAYRFNVSEKGKLALGIGGQLEQGRADWARTNPIHSGDNFILNANDRSSDVKGNVGLGAYFEYNNSFYIGLSVPQLLNSTFYRNEGISKYRTYYLMTGFVTSLSSNVRLMPGALVSFNQGAPFELDVNANLIFMDKLWVGLNYRLGDSLDGLIQYQLTNNLRAGLAYDFTTSELKNYSNGSLEFMLTYAFNNFSTKISDLRFF